MESNFLIQINSKFREASKEESASMLATASGIKAVKYTKISVVYEGQNRNACICKSFLNKGEKAITLNRLLYDIHIDS